MAIDASGRDSELTAPVAGCRGVGFKSGIEGGGGWIEGSLVGRGFGDARGTSSLGGGGG